MDFHQQELTHPPSRKKPSYPISNDFRQYLRQHGREVQLPVQYQDLQRFTHAVVGPVRLWRNLCAFGASPDQQPIPPLALHPFSCYPQPFLKIFLYIFTQLPNIALSSRMLERAANRETQLHGGSMMRAYQSK
ncbi:MAG: hypothetical protein RIR48_1991 [Bacteroidota bacterium]